MMTTLTNLLLASALFWSIGSDDGKFAEFVAAGNHSDAIPLLKAGVVYDVATSDASKIWPFVHPGPHDAWEGAKSHTFTVNFDLSDAPQEMPRDAAIYELQIKGWGQGSAPPVLAIDLNGEKTEIVTKRNPAGDKILKSSEGVAPESYRARFAANVVKPTGNVLTITTKSGSWFVYDVLQFVARDGNIPLAEVTATPLRGIFRGGATPAARKVVLRDIATPVQITAATCIDGDTSGIQPPPSVQLVKPTPTLDDISLLIPIPDDWIGKPLKTTLTISRENNEQDSATLEVKFAPEKKWEVYLIHQTHLDIGFTHTQVDVLERQVQALHDAIKYIDETQSYPEDAKFKFHPEGMWQFDEYFRRATPQQKQALIRVARERNLHIDGMYAQAMSAMYSDEELFQLFADAARFCRIGNIPLDSAMQTDVPGYTWGLVTAMAQNGIKYLTMGPNCGHRVGRLYETWGDKPFWWESPSGKERVLCWLLDTGYHQFHGKPLGHQISADEIFRILSGKDTIPRERSDERAFLYEDLVVVRYGIEGDNGRPNRVVSDVVKKWNEEYLYPRLIISRNSDVMRILEERYGSTIPVVRGDFTPYWEDGGASTSEATSINRRAKERLLQALTLWSMQKPKKFPVGASDAAWIDLMMYDEHTWGAHNSISEPDSDFVKQQDDYKQEYASRGAREVAEILEGAVDKSTPNQSTPNKNTQRKQVPATGSDMTSLSIANTLHWDLKGVRVLGDDLLAASNLPELSYWRDAAGNTVTIQTVPTARLPKDGVVTKTAYALFAQPLPPMSVTKLTPSNDTAISLSSSLNISSLFINAETGEMGNDMVKLVIDKTSGAISSIKQIGIEQDLVKAGDDGNRGINDYLYILGRDASENRARVEGDVKLTVLARGPVAASMLIESPAPNCKTLRRRVTVFCDSEKIHIENVLDKEMERRPEGTFFGFPFNVPDGTWRVDTPWAMVEVERDQISGANKNYYTVQRYCTLAARDFGVNWVTIDANMLQFAPILFTKAWGLKEWRETFGEHGPGGTLYSWLCNNHWETNYKAGQEGELRFEYWVWGYVNRYENAQAQLFARSVHQPPLLMPACDNVASFLTTDNGFIGVTSLRPCRDASGAVLVRLFNMSQEPQEATLTFRDTKATVWTSNPLEDCVEKVSNKVSLVPFETVTLRVEPSAPTPPNRLLRRR
ncbi:MAG: polysaccharide lyase family protein [Thermoguttaceae bacterium]